MSAQRVTADGAPGRNAHALTDRNFAGVRPIPLWFCNPDRRDIRPTEWLRLAQGVEGCAGIAIGINPVNVRLLFSKTIAAAITERRGSPPSS